MPIVHKAMHELDGIPLLLLSLIHPLLLPRCLVVHSNLANPDIQSFFGSFGGDLDVHSYLFLLPTLEKLAGKTKTRKSLLILTDFV